MFKGNDKNLVFGVLALQLDYIRPSDLIDGANAWMVAKQESIGGILVKRGVLSEEDREFLEMVVDKHIAKSGSIDQSLAILRNPGTDSKIQAWVAKTIDSDASGEIGSALGHWIAGTIDSDVSRRADSGETKDISTGTSVNSGRRYIPLRPLARGGLGQVSVARDPELEREVALKEMLENREWSADAKARFVAEAKITGGLEHPGIVPVYGMGVSRDGRPYYAMRLIRGISLQEAVDDFHALPIHDKRMQNEDAVFRKLIRSLIDACYAVAYAHNRGVIHRDLKPSNIMVGKFGETLVVDWGLAKTIEKSDDAALHSEALMQDVRSGDSAPTMMGTVLGTPSFMSPEQAEGRLDLMDQRTDVFSLGATLFVLLTGKLPYSSASRDDLLSAARRAEFDMPREIDGRIPKALEAVCLKAMARAPADRYDTAVELAEELDRWIVGYPVSAMKEPLIQQTIRWARRNQTMVTGFSVLVCVSLIALAIANWAIGVQRDIARHERDTANELRKEADVATETAKKERDIADGLRVKANQATKKAQHNSSVSIEILDRFVKGLADDKWAQVPQLEAERIKMVDLAVDRYSKLLDESPDDLRLKSDVVQVLVRSGNLYRMTGQREKAEAQIKRALAIIDELPTVVDDDSKAGLLSDTLFSLTSVTASRRGAKEAAPICNRNLVIARQRAETNPDSLFAKLGLGRVLLQHSELSLKLDQAPDCERDAREAAKLFQKIAKPLENQFVVHLYRFFAHTLVAKACLAQSELERAKPAIDRAVELGQATDAKFPGNNNVTDFLQQAMIERGRYLLLSDHSSEGTAILKGSLEIYRKLANDFPQTPSYRRVQAKINNILAAESLRNGTKKDAGDYASVSLSLINQLTFDEDSIAEYLPIRIEALAVLVLSSAENSEAFRTPLLTACQELERINPRHPLLDGELLQKSR